MWNDEQRSLFDEIISKSSEFDQYLLDHRDEDLFRRRMEYEAKIEHGKAILEEQERTPKRPSCGSSNISQIGVLGRTVSFQLFGFASSKIGKAHKCNHGGTTW